MRKLLPVLLLLPLLVAGCEALPDWMAGPKQEVKRAPGDRTDVVAASRSLKPDEAVKEVPIEIPEPATLDQWVNPNDAMKAIHLKLPDISHHQSAEIGDGNDFSQSEAPQPIVIEQAVIAMDAAGAISAHATDDIDKVLWTNKDGTRHRVRDVMGGGLTYDHGVVFATTGYGRLMAIDFKSGNLLWKADVGAPVRGAPAVNGGVVLVLTADGQALAYDETKGTPRWEHRGLRESAGYFSTTAPSISDDGIAVVAYTSGEVFALRADTGSALWSDTIGTTDKTRAADIFSGIDSDPIVQDGVVVVTSASGSMQASALLNGRPLWQQPIGAHMMPWSAGNALFVLTASHDVAAVFKRDGSVRWATSLAEFDARDKDITPPLFGPILADNKVWVASGDGHLHSFDPLTGERLKDYDIASDIVTPPVVAGGALYLVARDATLHKYY